MNEQAAAAWLKAQEALDQANEMLAQRDLRAAERAQAAMPAPAAPQPVRRAVTPREHGNNIPTRPPVAGKHIVTRRDGDGNLIASAFEGDSASSAISWQDYIERRISQKIMAFAEGFGAGIGEELVALRKVERERVDARLAELEARLEVRLGEFEERLKQAEARAAGGPRLVDDAAAD